MNSDDHARGRRAGREAAERYVELDAHPDAREREDALIEWLERAPEHEAAYERCEAAVSFARELVSRGDVQSANERFVDAYRRPAGWLAGLYRRPALAWSVAGVAVLAALLDVPGGPAADPPAPQVVSTLPGGPAPGAGIEAVDAAGRRSVAAAAAETAAQIRVAELPAAQTSAGEPRAGQREDAVPDTLPDTLRFAAIDRAAMLPGEMVVDVHSLAVLPFDGNADEGPEASAARRMAADLYEDVLRQLGAIPGLYVVDRSSSDAYDGRDIVPSDVAAYLGVRGIVEGELTFEGGRIHARLRVTDAAAVGRSFEQAFDRPVSELQVMRSDIVSSILTAMATAP